MNKKYKVIGESANYTIQTWHFTSEEGAIQFAKRMAEKNNSEYEIVAIIGKAKPNAAEYIKYE